MLGFRVHSSFSSRRNPHTVRTGYHTMAVADAGTIDIVAHDPARDEALLVMVEDRPWPTNGAFLTDLEAKLNTYLLYVTGGRLVVAFPDLKDKPVHFQLRTTFPPGERELEYLRLVDKQHLRPASIRFSWRIIGETHEHGL